MGEMKDRGDIYEASPMELIDGIPIFSELSEYIQNYEKISADHLARMGKTGENPFIPEDVWLELESSTKELILKYAEGGCRILDVGVGLGRLLALLPPAFEKYGMDISLGYLKIAQSKGINVCYSLIEDMPYKKNAFDMVVCTDVLEHVLDLNLACDRILSVLKDNGILIARVPYREDLSPYLSPDCPYKFVHLRSFDEYSLRLLFERVFNCEVLEYSTAVPVMQSSLFKHHVPTPIRPLIGSAIHRVKPANKWIYRYLVRSFFNPCVINCVVRK